MSGTHRLVTCARCARTRKHHGRGLCGTCRQWLARHDLLAAYPLTNTRRKRTDTYEDWLELQAQGYTRQHAADRLGITLGALKQVITRTQRAQQW